MRRCRNVSLLLIVGLLATSQLTAFTIKLASVAPEQSRGGVR